MQRESQTGRGERKVVRGGGKKQRREKKAHVLMIALLIDIVCTVPKSRGGVMVTDSTSETAFWYLRMENSKMNHM